MAAAAFGITERKREGAAEHGQGQGYLMANTVKGVGTAWTDITPSGAPVPPGDGAVIRAKGAHRSQEDGGSSPGWSGLWAEGPDSTRAFPNHLGGLCAGPT